MTGAARLGLVAAAVALAVCHGAWAGQGAAIISPTDEMAAGSTQATGLTALQCAGQRLTQDDATGVFFVSVAPAETSESHVHCTFDRSPPHAEVTFNGKIAVGGEEEIMVRGGVTVIDMYVSEGNDKALYRLVVDREIGDKLVTDAASLNLYERRRTHDCLVSLSTTVGEPKYNHTTETWEVRDVSREVVGVQIKATAFYSEALMSLYHASGVEEGDEEDDGMKLVSDELSDEMLVPELLKTSIVVYSPDHLTHRTYRLSVHKRPLEVPIKTACLNDCGNSTHGRCVDTKCVCNEGYTGDDCSIFLAHRAWQSEPDLRAAKASFPYSDTPDTPLVGTDATEDTSPFPPSEPRREDTYHLAPCYDEMRINAPRLSGSAETGEDDNIVLPHSCAEAVRFCVLMRASSQMFVTDVRHQCSRIVLNSFMATDPLHRGEFEEYFRDRVRPRSSDCEVINVLVSDAKPVSRDVEAHVWEAEADVDVANVSIAVTAAANAVLDVAGTRVASSQSVPASPAILLGKAAAHAAQQAAGSASVVSPHDSEAAIVGLLPGPNRVLVTAMAADGVETCEETVVIHRKFPFFPDAAKDATLSELRCASGLAKGVDFVPDNLVYHCNQVGSGNETTQITAFTADLDAYVAIDGQAVPRGQPYNASLLVGRNQITIDVRAADGAHSQTYRLYVTRAPEMGVRANTELRQMIVAPWGDTGRGVDAVVSSYLHPGFSSRHHNYTFHVPSTCTAVKIRATPADPAALLQIGGQAAGHGDMTGPIELLYGNNDVVVQILAQDQIHSDEWHVEVNRAYPEYDEIRSPSQEARLDQLQLSKGFALSPAFSPDVYEYTIRYSAQPFSVTANPRNEKAFVSLGRLAIRRKKPSPPLFINGERATNVTVHVLAEDLVSSAAYTMRVVGVGRQTVVLQNMRWSQGNLLPAFEPTTTAYTLFLPAPAPEQVFVIVEAGDGVAITVQGLALSNGEASQLLSVGSPEPVLIELTSQSRIYKRVYTISIGIEPERRSHNFLDCTEGGLEPGVDVESACGLRRCYSQIEEGIMRSRVAVPPACSMAVGRPRYLMQPETNMTQGKKCTCSARCKDVADCTSLVRSCAFVEDTLRSSLDGGDAKRVTEALDWLRREYTRIVLHNGNVTLDLLSKSNWLPASAKAGDVAVSYTRFVQIAASHTLKLQEPNLPESEWNPLKMRLIQHVVHVWRRYVGDGKSIEDRGALEFQLASDGFPAPLAAAAARSCGVGTDGSINFEAFSAAVGAGFVPIHMVHREPKVEAITALNRLMDDFLTVGATPGKGTVTRTAMEQGLAEKLGMANDDDGPKTLAAALERLASRERQDGSIGFPQYVLAAQAGLVPGLWDYTGNPNLGVQQAKLLFRDLMDVERQAITPDSMRNGLSGIPGLSKTSKRHSAFIAYLTAAVVGDGDDKLLLIDVMVAMCVGLLYPLTDSMSWERMMGAWSAFVEGADATPIKTRVEAQMPNDKLVSRMVRLGMDIQDAVLLLQTYDTKRAGTILFEDFVRMLRAGLLAPLNGAPSPPQANGILRQWHRFEAMEPSGGLVSLNDLMRALKHEEGWPSDVLQYVRTHLHFPDPARISFVDFYGAVNKGDLPAATLDPSQLNDEDGPLRAARAIMSGVASFTNPSPLQLRATLHRALKDNGFSRYHAQALVAGFSRDGGQTVRRDDIVRLVLFLFDGHSAVHDMAWGLNAGVMDMEVLLRRMVLFEELDTDKNSRLTATEFKGGLAQRGGLSDGDADMVAKLAGLGAAGAHLYAKQFVQLCYQGLVPLDHWSGTAAAAQLKGLRSLFGLYAEGGSSGGGSAADASKLPAVAVVEHATARGVPAEVAEAIELSLAGEDLGSAELARFVAAGVVPAVMQRVPRLHDLLMDTRTQYETLMKMNHGMTMRCASLQHVATLSGMGEDHAQLICAVLGGNTKEGVGMHKLLKAVLSGYFVIVTPKDDSDYRPGDAAGAAVQSFSTEWVADRALDFIAYKPPDDAPNKVHTRDITARLVRVDKMPIQHALTTTSAVSAHSRFTSFTDFLRGSRFGYLPISIRGREYATATVIALHGLYGELQGPTSPAKDAKRGVGYTTLSTHFYYTFGMTFCAAYRLAEAIDQSGDGLIQYKEFFNGMGRGLLPSVGDVLRAPSLASVASAYSEMQTITGTDNLGKQWGVKPELCMQRLQRMGVVDKDARSFVVSSLALTDPRSEAGEQRLIPLAVLNDVMWRGFMPTFAGTISPVAFHEAAAIFNKYAKGEFKAGLTAEAIASHFVHETLTPDVIAQAIGELAVHRAAGATVDFFDYLRLVRKRLMYIRPLNLEPVDAKDKRDTHHVMRFLELLAPLAMEDIQNKTEAAAAAQDAEEQMEMGESGVPASDVPASGSAAAVRARERDVWSGGLVDGSAPDVRRRERATHAAAAAAAAAAAPAETVVLGQGNDDELAATWQSLLQTEVSAGDKGEKAAAKETEKKDIEKKKKTKKKKKAKTASKLPGGKDDAEDQAVQEDQREGKEGDVAEDDAEDDATADQNEEEKPTMALIMAKMQLMFTEMTMSDVERKAILHVTSSGAASLLELIVMSMVASYGDGNGSEEEPIVMSWRPLKFLTRAFLTYDTDGLGFVPTAQLAKMLMQKDMRGNSLSFDLAHATSHLTDIDHDGKITLLEFGEAFSLQLIPRWRLSGEAQSIMQKVSALHDYFDRIGAGKGMVSRNMVRAAFTTDVENAEAVKATDGANAAAAKLRGIGGAASAAKKDEEASPPPPPHQYAEVLIEGLPRRLEAADVSHGVLRRDFVHAALIGLFPLPPVPAVPPSIPELQATRTVFQQRADSVTSLLSVKALSGHLADLSFEASAVETITAAAFQDGIYPKDPTPAAALALATAENGTDATGLKGERFMGLVLSGTIPLEPLPGKDAADLATDDDLERVRSFAHCYLGRNMDYSLVTVAMGSALTPRDWATCMPPVIRSLFMTGNLSRSGKQACENQTFELECDGDVGDGTFRWIKDGTDLADADLDLLNVYRVQTADQDDNGAYQCAVSNRWGESLSEVVSIEVVDCDAPATPNVCKCDGGVPVDEANCPAMNASVCQSCKAGHTLTTDKTECRPNVCVCENGKEAPPEDCNESGEHHCAECNDDYFLSNGHCVQSQPCTCQNGEPATGPDCPNKGGEHCTSCADFFHKGFNDKDSFDSGACVQNVCVCPDGDPVPPSQCVKHGYPQCASCTGNKHVDASGNCVPNQCTCPTGEPVPPHDCPEDGKEKCKKSDKPEPPPEVPNKCVCTGGTPVPPENCPKDGQEKCKECTEPNYYMDGEKCKLCDPKEGFHLSEDKKDCKSNVCKCDGDPPEDGGEPAKGVPTEGKDCPGNGEQHCRECPPFLKNPPKCDQHNICICENGEPEDKRCPDEKKTLCKAGTCKDHFHTEDSDCKQNECGCILGKPVGNAECWVHNPQPVPDEVAEKLQCDDCSKADATHMLVEHVKQHPICYEMECKLGDPKRWTITSDGGACPAQMQTMDGAKCQLECPLLAPEKRTIELVCPRPTPTPTVWDDQKIHVGYPDPDPPCPEEGCDEANFLAFMKENLVMDDSDPLVAYRSIDCLGDPKPEIHCSTQCTVDCMPGYGTQIVEKETKMECSAYTDGDESKGLRMDAERHVCGWDWLEKPDGGFECRPQQCKVRKDADEGNLDPPKDGIFTSKTTLEDILEEPDRNVECGTNEQRLGAPGGEPIECMCTEDTGPEASPYCNRRCPVRCKNGFEVPSAEAATWHGRGWSDSEGTARCAFDETNNVCEWDELPKCVKVTCPALQTLSFTRKELKGPVDAGEPAWGLAKSVELTAEGLAERTKDLKQPEEQREHGAAVDVTCTPANPALGQRFDLLWSGTSRWLPQQPLQMDDAQRKGGYGRMAVRCDMKDNHDAARDGHTDAMVRWTFVPEGGSEEARQDLPLLPDPDGHGHVQFVPCVVRQCPAEAKRLALLSAGAPDALFPATSLAVTFGAESASTPPLSDAQGAAWPLPGGCTAVQQKGIVECNQLPVTDDFAISGSMPCGSGLWSDPAAGEAGLRCDLETADGLGAWVVDKPCGVAQCAPATATNQRFGNLGFQIDQPYPKITAGNPPTIQWHDDAVWSSKWTGSLPLHVKTHVLRQRCEWVVGGKTEPTDSRFSGLNEATCDFDPAKRDPATKQPTFALRAECAPFCFQPCEAQSSPADYGASFVSLMAGLAAQAKPPWQSADPPLQFEPSGNVLVRGAQTAKRQGNSPAKAVVLSDADLTFDQVLNQIREDLDAHECGPTAALSSPGSRLAGEGTCQTNELKDTSKCAMECLPGYKYECAGESLEAGAAVPSSCKVGCVAVAAGAQFSIDKGKCLPLTCPQPKRAAIRSELIYFLEDFNPSPKSFDPRETGGAQTPEEVQAAIVAGLGMLKPMELEPAQESYELGAVVKMKLSKGGKDLVCGDTALKDRAQTIRPFGWLDSAMLATTTTEPPPSLFGRSSGSGGSAETEKWGKWHMIHGKPRQQACPKTLVENRKRFPRNPNECEAKKVPCAESNSRCRNLRTASGYSAPVDCYDTSHHRGPSWQSSVGGDPSIPEWSNYMNTPVPSCTEAGDCTAKADYYKAKRSLGFLVPGDECFARAFDQAPRKILNSPAIADYVRKNDEQKKIDRLKRMMEAGSVLDPTNYEKKHFYLGQQHDQMFDVDKQKFCCSTICGGKGTGMVGVIVECPNAENPQDGFLCQKLSMPWCREMEPAKYDRGKRVFDIIRGGGDEEPEREVVPPPPPKPKDTDVTLRCLPDTNHPTLGARWYVERPSKGSAVNKFEPLLVDMELKQQFVECILLNCPKTNEFDVDLGEGLSKEGLMTFEATRPEEGKRDEQWKVDCTTLDVYIAHSAEEERFSKMLGYAPPAVRDEESDTKTGPVARSFFRATKDTSTLKCSLTNSEDELYWKPAGPICETNKCKIKKFERNREKKDIVFDPFAEDLGDPYWCGGEDGACSEVDGSIGVKRQTTDSHLYQSLWKIPTTEPTTFKWEGSCDQASGKVGESRTITCDFSGSPDPHGFYAGVLDDTKCKGSKIGKKIDGCGERDGVAITQCDCEPGTHNPNPEQDHCNDCNPTQKGAMWHGAGQQGFWQSEAGEAECKSCGSATYTDVGLTPPDFDFNKPHDGKKLMARQAKATDRTQDCDCPKGHFWADADDAGCEGQMPIGVRPPLEAQADSWPCESGGSVTGANRDATEKKPSPFTNQVGVLGGDAMQWDAGSRTWSNFCKMERCKPNAFPGEEAHWQSLNVLARNGGELEALRSYNKEAMLYVLQCTRSCPGSGGGIPLRDWDSGKPEGQKWAKRCLGEPMFTPALPDGQCPRVSGSNIEPEAARMQSNSESVRLGSAKSEKVIKASGATFIFQRLQADAGQGGEVGDVDTKIWYKRSRDMAEFDEIFGYNLRDRVCNTVHKNGITGFSRHMIPRDDERNSPTIPPEGPCPNRWDHRKTDPHMFRIHQDEGKVADVIACVDSCTKKSNSDALAIIKAHFKAEDDKEASAIHIKPEAAAREAFFKSLEVAGDATEGSAVTYGSSNTNYASEWVFISYIAPGAEIHIGLDFPSFQWNPAKDFRFSWWATSYPSACIKPNDWTLPPDGSLMGRPRCSGALQFRHDVKVMNKGGLLPVLYTVPVGTKDVFVRFQACEDMDLQLWLIDEAGNKQEKPAFGWGAYIDEKKRSETYMRRNSIEAPRWSVASKEPHTIKWHGHDIYACVDECKYGAHPGNFFTDKPSAFPNAGKAESGVHAAANLIQQKVTKLDGRASQWGDEWIYAKEIVGQDLLIRVNTPGTKFCGSAYFIADLRGASGYCTAEQGTDTQTGLSLGADQVDEVSWQHTAYNKASKKYEASEPKKGPGQFPAPPGCSDRKKESFCESEGKDEYSTFGRSTEEELAPEDMVTQADADAYLHPSSSDTPEQRKQARYDAWDAARAAARARAARNRRSNRVLSPSDRLRDLERGSLPPSATTAASEEQECWPVTKMPCPATDDGGSGGAAGGVRRQAVRGQQTALGRLRRTVLATAPARGQEVEEGPASSESLKAAAEALEEQGEQGGQMAEDGADEDQGGEADATAGDSSVTGDDAGSSWWPWTTGGPVVTGNAGNDEDEGESLAALEDSDEREA